MQNSKKCVILATYWEDMIMAFIISGFSDEIDDSIDVQFQTLNALGIEYFEPRGIDGKNVSTLNHAEAKALRSKMDSYSIKASSIGSPIGKIDIEDDFASHLELLKRLCDTAHTLDTRFMRIFSFYVPKGRADEYREKVLEQMSKMTELAKREDIVLLHENEKDVYGDLPERCLDLFENIKSEHFKAVFDPANFVQCGVSDVPAAFDLLSENVVYMHIKDSKRDGTVVPAGEGDGGVEKILRRLKSLGYNGFLSLEPHLGTFSGLRALEKSDDMMKLEKASAKTFGLAHSSLLTILERI